MWQRSGYVASCGLVLFLKLRKRAFPRFLCSGVLLLVVIWVYVVVTLPLTSLVLSWYNTGCPCDRMQGKYARPNRKEWDVMNERYPVAVGEKLVARPVPNVRLRQGKYGMKLDIVRD